MHRALSNPVHWLCIFSVSAPELHPHCACTQIGSPKKRRKKRFSNVVEYGVLSGRLVRNRMCYFCHQSRLFVLCCPSLFVCSEQGGSVFLSWTVWVDLPCAVFLWLSFSDSPVWIESLLSSLNSTSPALILSRTNYFALVLIAAMTACSLEFDMTTSTSAIGPSSVGSWLDFIWCRSIAILCGISYCGSKWSSNLNMPYTPGSNMPYH